VECDVTKLSDIERLKNAVKNRFKTCHILFTNADGPPSGALDDFRSEDYEKAIRLNLLSTIQLVYAFIPFMKRQKWGRVIASTSSNVRCLLPQFPLSNVSRIGIVAFIKTLAHEFAPFNVTANVLAPGLFLTEPTIDFIKDCSKRKRIKYSEALREIQGTIPAQTIGRPEDYGALAAFLASGWASYITGETILIDGGQHCLVM
jgi:3-oxoacyl-[acyl-carrier protein] reductase